MGPEKPGKSRRDFLRSAIVFGAGALATSLVQPITGVIVAAEEPEDKEKPWYGYGIDISKCIGCGNCAKACKKENNVPEEPFYFRTWIESYTIKEDGEVIIEAPNGGIDGFEQKIPDKEITSTFFVPKLCNHCHKSPCVQVCPVGATYDSPEGVVLVDEKYCIGCRYCVQACPYGCRYIHPEKDVVDKCTLCYHRITKGLDPACIENCPTGARIYGNLHDKNSELVKFLKKNICMVLKPHLNTGSKLYYNDLRAEVR